MLTNHTVNVFTAGEILDSAQKTRADSNSVSTGKCGYYTYRLRGLRFSGLKYFSFFKMEQYTSNCVTRFLELKILFSIQRESKPQSFSAHIAFLGHTGTSRIVKKISYLRLYLQNCIRVPDLLAFFRHSDVFRIFYFKHNFNTQNGGIA